MSSEDLTGVIFGMGVLVLGTIILVVVLTQGVRYLNARADHASNNRFAELNESYQTLARKVAEGQADDSAALADIRSRVVEIERLLRDVA